MITVIFCLYIKQFGGIRMENKVYTQSELKAQNIITTDYVPNLEPGGVHCRPRYESGGTQLPARLLHL